MIRFFVLIGIVGGLAVAYLATYAVGPISQRPPTESLLTDFRAEGYVPASLNLEEDETAEESSVFEVPESDAVNIAAAVAAMAGSGMDMSGSDGATMDMSGANSTTMDMTATDSATMDMTETDSTTMDMTATDSTTMDMANTEGDNAPIVSDELEMGEGGLVFYSGGAFDREINLDMAEWEFSEMQIDVKMGERIKFTVKNNGQIPHEFMFMSPTLMQGVAYRNTRADWSLFEHVALFEKALVLPGGEFTFVMEVQQNGAWMFMCMLPYHMQLGMMGQIATAGAAMNMDM